MANSEATSDLNMFYEIRGQRGETLGYVRDIVDVLFLLRNIDGASTVWRMRDGELMAVHPRRRPIVSEPAIVETLQAQDIPEVA